MIMRGEKGSFGQEIAGFRSLQNRDVAPFLIAEQMNGPLLDEMEPFDRTIATEDQFTRRKGFPIGRQGREKAWQMLQHDRDHAHVRLDRASLLQKEIMP